MQKLNKKEEKPTLHIIIFFLWFFPLSGVHLQISQPINQSISHSFNQPTNQPNKQTTNQTTTQSINQPTIQLTNQPTKQPTTLPIKHPPNQSINQSINQTNYLFSYLLISFGGIADDAAMVLRYQIKVDFISSAKDLVLTGMKIMH